MPVPAVHILNLIRKEAAAMQPVVSSLLQQLVISCVYVSVCPRREMKTA